MAARYNIQKGKVTDEKLVELGMRLPVKVQGYVIDSPFNRRLDSALAKQSHKRKSASK